MLQRSESCAAENVPVVIGLNRSTQDTLRKCAHLRTGTALLKEVLCCETDHWRTLGYTSPLPVG